MLLPWMAPHKVIPWQRAIVLSFLGKVEVVVEYDEIVRSPSIALRAPAVVRMRRAEIPRRGTTRFCRDNVFRRDRFACQYCGAVLRARELTFDHVVPRARGGRTDWDNIVTCCRPCNDRKRDRTPEEAGMKLARRPVRPGWLPPAPEIHVEHQMPDEWRAFVA
ncbi:MAG TPA: HNH endonuclease [Polyangiaceae bacterium]|jgi:5-methylcytosine-specific restriction endonuclease McrA